MTLLHDPSTRDAMRRRIQGLSPQSVRKWGKMTVDQMLWHCSEALDNALGKDLPNPLRFPLPMAIIRFFTFNLPWPKGAPTHPGFVTGERHSFDAERDRLLGLLDRFTAKPLDASDWGTSPAFGKMTGRDWSRLQAKHLDHHLKQFSA